MRRSSHRRSRPGTAKSVASPRTNSTAASGSAQRASMMPRSRRQGTSRPARPPWPRRCRAPWRCRALACQARPQPASRSGSAKPRGHPACQRVVADCLLRSPPEPPQRRQTRPGRTRSSPAICTARGESRSAAVSAPSAIPRASVPEKRSARGRHSCRLCVDAEAAAVTERPDDDGAMGAPDEESNYGDHRARKLAAAQQHRPGRRSQVRDGHDQNRRPDGGHAGRLRRPSNALHRPMKSDARRRHG